MTEKTKKKISTVPAKQSGEYSRVDPTEQNRLLGYIQSVHKHQLVTGASTKEAVETLFSIASSEERTLLVRAVDELFGKKTTEA